MKNTLFKTLSSMMILCMALNFSPAMARSYSQVLPGPGKDLPVADLPPDLPGSDRLGLRPGSSNQLAREYAPPTPADVARTAEQVRTFDCSTVTEIPQIECEALVALYGSTNGAGWFNHSNWLETTTVSSWNGVTVAADHVAFLTLYNNHLSGSLPPELGNLSNLLILHLGLNMLSGSIPPELGNIFTLQNLNLHSNQLTGSIPQEMGKLSNLFYLYLYNNQLSGSIPLGLGTLSNLYSLYLDSNQLTGSIPLSFVNLTSLHYFSFSNTFLCEPATPEFLNWKLTLEEWDGTGFMCSYCTFLPLTVR